MEVLIFTVLAAALLTACGGGSSGAQVAFPATPASAAAPAITSPAQESINGIPVPPDPGAEKDSTVAGIDTDKNGIRDEIDRWIATKFGDKPGALEAIRMNLKTSQKLLMMNPQTQAEALAIAFEDFDVGICTGNKLRTEGVNASAFFNEQFLRTYNTRERLDRHKKQSSMTGMIVRNVNDSTVDCPFIK